MEKPHSQGRLQLPLSVADSEMEVTRSLISNSDRTSTMLLMLPVELLLDVFDKIQLDDAYQLFTLRRVCRVFRDLLDPKLFAIFNYNFNPPPKWAERVSDSVSDPLTSLLESSPTPAPLTHAREVGIYFRSEWGSNGGEYLTKFSEETLPNVLGMIPNLSEVCVFLTRYMTKSSVAEINIFNQAVCKLCSPMKIDLHFFVIWETKEEADIEVSTYLESLSNLRSLFLLRDLTSKDSSDRFKSDLRNLVERSPAFGISDFDLVKQELETDSNLAECGWICLLGPRHKYWVDCFADPDTRKYIESYTGGFIQETTPQAIGSDSEESK